ncbi:CU044_2847 family protein [Streptomyces sp. NPDC047315]|uniref:CU044_2847 family protein n=1 Tax=Streptomyces sp. NPDC047315 TaxID=3155142 RepID=UPI0033F5D792
MNGRVQQIELPGGAVVHARLSAPEGGYGDDDEDVGFVENATAKVQQLHQLITDVGASVLRAAAAAGPDQASVTFGVELTAKSGAALAVLASGETKASVQVTLVWQLKDQPESTATTTTTAAPAPVPPPPTHPPQPAHAPAPPEAPPAPDGRSGASHAAPPS